MRVTSEEMSRVAAKDSSAQADPRRGVRRAPRQECRGLEKKRVSDPGRSHKESGVGVGRREEVCQSGV